MANLMELINKAIEQSKNALIFDMMSGEIKDSLVNTNVFNQKEILFSPPLSMYKNVYKEKEVEKHLKKFIVKNIEEIMMNNMLLAIRFSDDNLIIQTRTKN